MPHQHATRVARQPAGRFRGNVVAVLQHRLSGLIRVREGGGIDVDDHLIPLARGPGIEVVVKGRLGNHAERVGLLLAEAGRIAIRIVHTSLRIHPIAGGGERLAEYRADLRREPAADDQHAVFILIHVQGAVAVSQRRLLILCIAIDSPPAAHEPLDVGRRAGFGECEQTLFRLRHGHARQGSDLRVGELAARQRRSQAGQIRQGARHADTLSRGAQVHADAPRQPLGTRFEAIGPASANVEVTNEVEHAGRGHFNVRGQQGNLVAQTFQFLDLGNSKTNQQIMFALTKISRTIGAASLTDTECFRIFRADQRALGELMIEPDSKPGERRCMGYATFCSKLTDEGYAEWGQELLNHVELAALQPALARDRLTKLQHQLIDLIDLLDTEGRRFPSEERSRFTPRE